jgi:hypothetical protein
VGAAAGSSGGMMALSFLKSIADAVSPVFRPAGNIISGISPGDWASPQNPIRVVTQRGVGIRTWDFTPGINLQFTPRGDQAVSFQQLYRVSNSFDLCRLMIETRKDQVVNRAWQIRVKKRPGEKNADHLARAVADPDVEMLTALLLKPDGVHTLDLWIRMWLEQLLTFDAPCIYPMKSVLGSVIMPAPGIAGGFRIVAGQTITPLLDQQGFRPMPPDPAFQQVILGSPTSTLMQALADPDAKKFTADQLIYSPRNPRVDSRWGFGPVEQIITTLQIAANRQQSLKDYYVSGNVPEGLLSMPESWTMNQIRDFQTWFDSMLAGNLARKRRMIMIPATERGAQFSKEKLLTDGTDDYLVRVVAFAFSVTPQNLIKQVNRGTAKESTDVAQIEGLEPVLKHIENVLNEVIQIARPGTKCEFAYQDEREMDPVKQAQVDEIYINTGTYSRNEIRVARGDDQRPEPGASALTVTSTSGVSALDDAVTAGANSAAQAGQDPEGGDDPNGGRGGPGGGSGGSRAGKLFKRAALKIKAGDLTTRARDARRDGIRVLQRFLKAQSLRVAADVRAEYSKAQKLRKAEGDEGDTTERDTARALAILAAIQWQYPDLFAALKPYLQTAAEEGAKTGAYQLAANAGSSLTEILETAVARARDAAADRAAQLVGMDLGDDGTLAVSADPFWAMSTTAQTDVLASIRQAITEDWTPAQLEAVVQAATVFSDDHAEMIGDNEVVRQSAGGHLIAWLVDKQILEHRWDVVAGCCSVCLGFHDQGSVPVGHEFAPGITAPGAHPFCRCHLTATKFKDDPPKEAPDA